MTIKELEALVASFQKGKAPEETSPYEATRWVNATLGTDLPAQMLYQYVGKGTIKGSKNSLGHWVIRKDDLASWMFTYGLRNLVSL